MHFVRVVGKTGTRLPIRPKRKALKKQSMPKGDRNTPHVSRGYWNPETDEWGKMATLLKEYNTNARLAAKKVLAVIWKSMGGIFAPHSTRVKAKDTELYAFAHGEHARCNKIAHITPH